MLHTNVPKIFKSCVPNPRSTSLKRALLDLVLVCLHAVKRPFFVQLNNKVRYTESTVNINKFLMKGSFDINVEVKSHQFNNLWKYFTIIWFYVM